VPIGMDDDGDIIESCVIVESDVHVEAGVRTSSRRAADKKRKAESSKWQSIVLDIYQELALGGNVLRSELTLRAKAKARVDHKDMREGRTNYLVGRAIDQLVQAPEEKGKAADAKPYYEESGFVFDKGAEQ